MRALLVLILIELVFIGGLASASYGWRSDASMLESQATRMRQKSATSANAPATSAPDLPAPVNEVAAGLAAKVQQAAASAGVRVQTLRLVQPPAVGDEARFRPVQLAARATGGYVQLKAFLAPLVEQEPWLEVSRLRLQKSDATQRGVDLEVEAQIWGQ